MHAGTVYYKGETYTLDGLLADETRKIKDFVALDNRLRDELGLEEVKSFKDRVHGAKSLLKHLAILGTPDEVTEKVVEEEEVAEKEASEAALPTIAQEKHRRSGRHWFQNNADRSVKLVANKFQGQKTGKRWEARQIFEQYMGNSTHTIREIREALHGKKLNNVVSYVIYEIAFGRLVFVD